jgi:hypothetical protein
MTDHLLQSHVQRHGVYRQGYQVESGGVVGTITAAVRSQSDTKANFVGSKDIIYKLTSVWIKFQERTEAKARFCTRFRQKKKPAPDWIQISQGKEYMASRA